MTPFVIFALPRSRTTWLSEWLDCGHDLMPYADSVAQFIGAILRRGGTVETGAMVAWRALRKAMPGAPIVTIRRPVFHVWDSLQRQTTMMDRSMFDALMARNVLLDEIETAGALSIQYDRLASPKTCAMLWDHLKPEPFDLARWRTLDAVNLNTDVEAAVQAQLARIDRINGVWLEAKQLDAELQGMEA